MEFLRSYWVGKRQATNIPQAANSPKRQNREESEEIILKLPSGKLFCFLCKEYLRRVPDYRNEVVKLEHKCSESHLAVLNTTKRHSICFDNSKHDLQLLCRICKRRLYFDEMVNGHIRVTAHVAWFSEMENLIVSKSLLVNTCFIAIDKFLSSESEFAHCKICDIDIECTANGINKHKSTKSHREGFLRILKPCTSVFPVENNKVMWCKACDLWMDNNVDQVLQHLTESEEHGDWFETVDLMADQDISIADFLKYEKEMNAKCLRCDLKIKANPKSIQAHVLSEPHRYRYKHKHDRTVQSLAYQNIWPSWCRWKFFGNPAFDNIIGRLEVLIWQ